MPTNERQAEILKSLEKEASYVSSIFESIEKEDAQATLEALVNLQSYLHKTGALKNWNDPEMMKPNWEMEIQRFIASCKKYPDQDARTQDIYMDGASRILLLRENSVYGISAGNKSTRSGDDGFTAVSSTKFIEDVNKLNQAYHIFKDFQTTPES